MKKIIFILLAALMLFSLAACKETKENSETEVSQTSDEPTFSLINMTDIEIHSIYISVSNMENWGSNQLGKNEVFRRGSEKEMYFKASDTERYDIRCDDSDGNSVVFAELPLYTINKLTLTLDENGKTIAYSQENGEVMAETTTQEVIELTTDEVVTEQ